MALVIVCPRMTTSETPKNRMIFKILILGGNPGRRNGFLRAAAGERISCQLHSSIGVSLGVAQTHLSSGENVALQFWALPNDPQYDGLIKSFVKGHKGIILILEAGDEGRIESFFENIPVESVHSTLAVIVGAVQDRAAIMTELRQAVGKPLERSSAKLVHEVVDIMAAAMTGNDGLPMVVEIPEAACPIYEPELRIGTEEHNSPEEVEEIRNVAHGLGLRTSGNTCEIEVEEGRLQVSMLSGRVLMRPTICEYCRKNCSRRINICIIGQDSGWSSDSHRTKAMLTMAKIVALAERDLPQHVENQLLRSSICRDFAARDDAPAEILETLIRSDAPYNKESLLEVADRRVKEGRLPEPLYNMLKRRLERVSSA